MFRHILRHLTEGPVTEPAPEPGIDALAELGERVRAAAQARLGRSLSIREVDAGSCNGCELEIHALNNPIYDLDRFGLRFVASPRHADVLLVTGPVTRNMEEALRRTWDATPEPKWVIAAGGCAMLSLISSCLFMSPAALTPPRPAPTRRGRNHAPRTAPGPRRPRRRR